MSRADTLRDRRATAPTAGVAVFIDVRSGRRAEQLERDVVRIAERQAGAVVGIHDAAVRDVERVEVLLPHLELSAVGAAEGDVIETGTMLFERLAGLQLGEAVHPEQGVAEQVDRVMEGACVL